MILLVFIRKHRIPFWIKLEHPEEGIIQIKGLSKEQRDSHVGKMTKSGEAYEFLYR